MIEVYRDSLKIIETILRITNDHWWLLIYNTEPQVAVKWLCILNLKVPICDYCQLQQFFTSLEVSFQFCWDWIFQNRLWRKLISWAENWFKGWTAMLQQIKMQKKTLSLVMTLLLLLVIAFMSTMIKEIHQIVGMKVVYRRRIGDGAGHLSIG